MIFMMYLDTYCRESVGNYCYKSGAQYVVTFPQPVHNFSFSLNSLSKSEFLSFHFISLFFQKGNLIVSVQHDVALFGVSR